jgi:hypothetical protein
VRGEAGRHTISQFRGAFKLLGLTEIRAVAMGLPGVEEGPPVRAARRIAAFKVAGKSFLGVEAGGKTITVSLAEDEAKAIAAERREAYEEIWRNGTIFMGLRVHLAKVPGRRVRELIEKSWRHTAPKRIVAEYDKTTART